MNELLAAIVLGIIEGLTEFLPVSSTGHLLIAQSIMGRFQSDAFNILIQIGPIFAVTLVFRKHIIELFTNLADTKNRDELLKLAVCFVLTGIGGLIAKISGLELPDSVLPITVATLVGALIIAVVERMAKNKPLSDTISWPLIPALAGAQLLAAIFPGTSRSGAIVITALALGVSRISAIRFAFLVGIPTMFAAGALQIAMAISQGQTADLTAPNSLVAFVVATATAWISVVWLLRFVQKNTFIPFAWYRLVLGCLMAGLMLLGIVN